MESKTVEYDCGDITIVWQPHLCIHAGICVKMLPNVYKPTERPWVQPSETSVDELITQISACPSGALTYRTNS